MHFNATSKVCTAYLFSSMTAINGCKWHSSSLGERESECEREGQNEKEIVARLNAYRKKGDQINSATTMQQGTEKKLNK